MGSRQLVPGASVASDDELVTTGQSEGSLLPIVKSELILGLLPAKGTVIDNGEFPSFANVTVWGLSALAVPIGVPAKFKAGVFAKSALTSEFPPR